MKESQIEKKAVIEATKLGWWGIKLSPQYLKGIPDRCFLGHSKVVFIEYKKPGGKLSALQEKVHIKFEKHGIKVYTIDSVKETLDILEYIKEN